MKAKYVDPFTDFGFKKIFGEQASKPMLIDFLNSLLPESKIVDLTFKDKEKLGMTDANRNAVYDIYCENINGEKIIVELQKAKQNYFRDRTVYYSTFPIQEQAQKGSWDFQLKYVYCIGILDFKFEDVKLGKEEVIHTVQLKDQNNQIFYDKLKFVYIEMPNFNKEQTELSTRLDKWLYFLKHLVDFEIIPEIFKDNIFVEAFKKAEIANYSYDEQNQYQQSLKTYRDYVNTFDYAFQDGRNQGIEQGIKEGLEKGIEQGYIKSKFNVINTGIDLGIGIEQLSKLTGLTISEIENY